jgi:hypothetical protein
MKRNEVWMLLALGLLVLTRKRVAWPDGWVWPLASVNVAGRLYRPVVSDGWGSPRGDKIHTGVDILFRRRSATDLADKFRSGSRDGTPLFFAPRTVPVLAARQARVWSVQKTPKGWAVVLDHGPLPFATFYQHLESASLPIHQGGVNVNTGQPTFVNTGDVLGFMGFDPTNASVRHLHFEVHHEGGFDAAVDPEQAMQAWRYASLIVNVT